MVMGDVQNIVQNIVRDNVQLIGPVLGSHLVSVLFVYGP